MLFIKKCIYLFMFKFLDLPVSMYDSIESKSTFPACRKILNINSIITIIKIEIW